MMYFVVESQLKDAEFSNGACAQASNIDDQRFFAAKIRKRRRRLCDVHTFQVNDDLYCKAFNGRHRGRSFISSNPSRATRRWWW